MKRIWLLVIAGGVCAALAVPCLIFLSRPPVLVVTEAPFAALYGADHLRRERVSASRALFRRVKPVRVADGASPDIVIFAITEASPRPMCVLFARTQAGTALLFHEQFPEIPVVVISGLTAVPELPAPDGLLCVYGTDRETDLYRAGLFAGILGNARQPPPRPAENQAETAPASQAGAPAAQTADRRTYVLWQDRYVRAAGREIFSRGLMEEDPESTVIFANSAGQVPDMKGISCMVLTGAGSEYLDKNPTMPLILFAWTDPAFTAKEVIIQFDDSPWALAVPAARMAAQQQADGKIPSKPLIFSGKIADNSIFRLLKKSAEKTPLKET